MIEGGEEVLALAQERGAQAVDISGAGPTIIAVVHKDDDEVFARAREALPKSDKRSHFTLYRLLADNAGAAVEA